MISPSTFFKCLSDETRLLATLLIYKEGELCVCELIEAMNESQPKISRHLANYAHMAYCWIVGMANGYITP